MPLVVLTYPGHFLLTALTIQSYLKFHTPTSITVIADDLSDFVWPDYLADCERQYGCKIISVSTIEPAQALQHNPWVRQQIVKLHLDQILPYDSWFFTDGDVEYYFPAPHDATPYTIIRGGPTQDHQNAYVADMLGITNPGVYAEHPLMDWYPDTRRHQVCVSNPPFRTMQSHILQKLRAYIEQLHNQTVIQLHERTNHLVSEWELIANFQIHVLKENINLVYYATVPMDNPPTPGQHRPNYCSTCYNSDSGYTREWWGTKGIQVSDRIWNIISKISK
jgi:hypothetical protein